MSAEPTMSTHTWTVNYSDFRTAVDGASIPFTVTVEAAYFTLDEPLIVFKDVDHQVVLAMLAVSISTVFRDDAPVQWGTTA